MGSRAAFEGRWAATSVQGRCGYHSPGARFRCPREEARNPRPHSKPSLSPGACHQLSSPEHRGRPLLRALRQERGANLGLTVRWTPCSLGASVTWSAASAEPALVLRRRMGRDQGRVFKRTGAGPVGRPLPPPAPDCTPRRGGALEGLRVCAGHLRFQPGARRDLCSNHEAFPRGRKCLRQEMT